jgi:uncharacterized membrane protein (UPF0127 family)
MFNFLSKPNKNKNKPFFIASRFLLILFSLGILTCLFLALQTRSAQSEILAQSRDGRIAVLKINEAIIKVELAFSQQAEYRGLSFRKALSSDSGMLFVFRDYDERNFVMRNMNFPLDILFIKDNLIINIWKNLPPEGALPQNIYSSGGEANLVLELPGGYCQEKGIKIGDQLEIISEK